jgi:hypothetical protein
LPRGAWASALALAACALLAFWPREGAPATRTKGGPELRVFVKRGDAVFEHDDSRAVAPGDVLRFVVVPAGHSHVAVLSRTQRGEVSIYSQAEALPPGAAKHALAGAIELDEVVVDETLHALLCKQPFALGPLERELSGTGRIRERADCAVIRVPLEKVARP